MRLKKIEKKKKKATLKKNNTLLCNELYDSRKTKR